MIPKRITDLGTLAVPAIASLLILYVIVVIVGTAEFFDLGPRKWLPALAGAVTVIILVVWFWSWFGGLMLLAAIACIVLAIAVMVLIPMMRQAPSQYEGVRDALFN